MWAQSTNKSKEKSSPRKVHVEKNRIVKVEWRIFPLPRASTPCPALPPAILNISADIFISERGGGSLSLLGKQILEGAPRLSFLPLLLGIIVGWAQVHEVNALQLQGLKLEEGLF